MTLDEPARPLNIILMNHESFNFLPVRQSTETGLAQAGMTISAETLPLRQVGPRQQNHREFFSTKYKHRINTHFF